MIATGSDRRAGSAGFRFLIALSLFFAFLIFAAPPALAQEEQKQEGQEEEVVPADEKESEPPAEGTAGTSRDSPYPALMNRPFLRTWGHGSGLHFQLGNSHWGQPGQQAAGRSQDLFFAPAFLLHTLAII